MSKKYYINCWGTPAEVFYKPPSESRISRKLPSYYGEGNANRGLAYVIAKREASEKHRRARAIGHVIDDLYDQFKRALVNAGYAYRKSDVVEAVLEKTGERLSKLIPNMHEAYAVESSDLAANLNDVFREARDHLTFSVDLVASSHILADRLNRKYDRMMAMLPSDMQDQGETIISRDLIKYAFQRVVTNMPLLEDSRDVFVTEDGLRNQVRKVESGQAIGYRFGWFH